MEQGGRIFPLFRARPLQTYMSGDLCVLELTVQVLYIGFLQVE